jgi:hypothetical protein
MLTFLLSASNFRQGDMTVFKRKSCIDCIFCTRNFRSPDDHLEKIFSLTLEQRAKAKEKNFSFIRDVDLISEYLQCYKGQWSEVLSGTDTTSIRNSLTKRTCQFYYSHSKGAGKFLPAIEKELDNSRISKAAQNANWSLLIATLSLLISLLMAWKGI